MAFRPPGLPFTIQVPEGWARRGEGTATVFTDRFTSIRIDATPRSQPPSVGATSGEDLPAALRPAPGRAAARVSAVQRKAGQAILLSYRTRSAPEPRTGKTVVQAVQRYEYWHRGLGVRATLSAPQGVDHHEAWRRVTDSLRWTR